MTPDKDFFSALMRCRQLEEQWRRARAANTGIAPRLTRVGKPVARSCLNYGSRVIDTILKRSKSIQTIAEYAAHCDRFEVISFDVFDTLLYRTVEPPDFLKRRTANFAAHLLSGYGLSIHRELFLYVRAEEEARLRRRALARGFDSECKLSELVRATLQRLAGAEVADRESPTLVNYELDVEAYHLRVAPGVVELLSLLQSRGKRLVAVSDTYLETSHLQFLFKTLGIQHYFNAIYVSADHGIGKYSGRLFKLVIEAERVRSQQMIHVGDNYGSDVRGAIRTGVCAVFLRDRRRLRNRQEVTRRTAAVVSGAEIVSSPVKRPDDQAVDAREKELFRIGHDILGPAFSAFILRVVEECYRWRVSDIYFLAREGYLLQKIHGILLANVRRFASLTPIPAHYLYVSRLATSLPALDCTEERNLQLARFRNRDAGLDESLRAFGLSLDDVKDLVSSLDAESSTAVGQLFSDQRFVSRVQRLSLAARQRLKAYLAAEGFFADDKSVALVDIGWSATIQANLTRAFHRDVDFPTIVGFYFGRRYAHEDDYALSPRSQFLPGLIFDERRIDPAEHAIDRCVEIFEISASAPHGATLDYRDDGGVISPLLNASPTELTREQELLQAGILAYTEEFSHRYNDHEQDFEVLARQAAKGLRRLICRPSHQEAAAFKDLRHSIDWGSQAFRPLVATELSLASILSPGRLLASLRHCCWPEGSLRYSGIPGGLLLMSGLRRALRSRQNLRKLARFCANLFRGRASSTTMATPVVLEGTEIAGATEKGKA